MAEQRAKVQAAQKRQRQENRKPQFKRADQLIDDYCNVEKESHRIKGLRVRRTKKDLNVENGKLLLVVRNDSVQKDHPGSEKCIKNLRITKHNSAAFVCLDEKTAIDLKDIKPYVNYGVPSRETVTALIQKRGYTWIDNKPVTISNNTMIEDKLGEYGVICVEDIIHEILTTGQHFDVVNRFLRPFRFSVPQTGHEKKMERLVEKNRDQDVNEMVAAMN